MPAKLVKIGDLAKELRLLPSTIHFYTQQGLLRFATTTRGGYRLYHLARASQRLKTIQHLQNKKRLTINEIKRTLR
jgi:DNA-binding transcriptional MerR regulator